MALGAERGRAGLDLTPEQVDKLEFRTVLPEPTSWELVCPVCEHRWEPGREEDIEPTLDGVYGPGDRAIPFTNCPSCEEPLEIGSVGVAEVGSEKLRALRLRSTAERDAIRAAKMWEDRAKAALTLAMWREGEAEPRLAPHVERWLSHLVECRQASDAGRRALAGEQGGRES